MHTCLGRISFRKQKVIAWNYESCLILPFGFKLKSVLLYKVWLGHANETRSPPEQLPIVLQVLLSQIHRLRALDLLGRFLDLGPWAVGLALSVGIFPYILKLLQSNARELRAHLVFIWAKILAVDASSQVADMKTASSLLISGLPFTTLFIDSIQH